MRHPIVLWLLLLVSGLWLGTPSFAAGKAVAKGKDMPADAAVELTEEQKEELELFKKLPRPEKRPKVDKKKLDSQQKRLAELVDIHNELSECLRERKTLLAETDEKALRKNQRKVSKMDREIRKLKKDLVKEAEKLRRPLDRKYEEYMEEKADYDKKIEEAEKSNNERKVEKLAQEFARKGNRIEGVKTQIDCINYYLFWD